MLPIRHDLVAEFPVQPGPGPALGEANQDALVDSYLISLMYLICYMDRSNISVAQPEIAKQFRLEQDRDGAGSGGFYLGLRAGSGSSRMVGRSLRAEESSDGNHDLVVGRCDDDRRGGWVWSLFGARFLLGVGEAGAFPVASRGMQLWFPRSERGRIQGTTHFFSRFAVAVTPFVAGSIMIAFGWRAIFYIFGSLGVLWAIGFQYASTGIFPKITRESIARNWLRSVASTRTAPSDALDHSAAAGSMEENFALAEHVVHRTSVTLASFSEPIFISLGIPPICASIAICTLAVARILGSLPLFAGMLGDVIGGALSDLILQANRQRPVRAADRRCARVSSWLGYS